MNEAQVLLATAATVAFTHTVLGPDHYVVFAAMGRARKWSLAKTLRVTLLCGLGHVLSSVVLGFLGIIAGARLAALVEIESVRGNFAGWALIAFGLVYLAWGLKQAGRGHSHSHIHVHGDVVHEHRHTHHTDHAHVHEEGSRHAITPWAMFVIFVLGPCEALIPLLMYPAARHSNGIVIAVAVVFGVITLITMLACVTLTLRGFERFRFATDGRYMHALAGAIVLGCGLLVSFAGM
jgi:nickel/cobalt transporter (NicO) family protein